MEFLDGFDDASDANRNDCTCTASRAHLELHRDRARLPGAVSKDYEWTSAEECQDATQRAEQLAVALQRPSRASLVNRPVMRADTALPRARFEARRFDPIVSRFVRYLLADRERVSRVDVGDMPRHLFLDAPQR
jgi:hypothetical protein